MGRREAPVDNGTAELARFAEGLRELRRAAGTPPYRELARDTHYSVSTLSVAASGKTLPSREVTLAFVRACAGDEAEWENRWQLTRNAVDGRPAPEPAAPLEPSGGGRARRLPRWTILAGVLGVVAASLIWLPNSRSDPTSDRTPPAGPSRAGPVDNCPVTEGHDNDVWQPDGGDGWKMWRGPAVGGCSGTAAYSSVTGLPDTWDDVFSWSHSTGDPASCRVSVFVPEAPVEPGVAEYDVYGVDRVYENRLTSFSVDQREKRGEWVERGPFDIPDGVLNIELVDRGAGDHVVVAGPVRFDCTEQSIKPNNASKPIS